jgi:TRAP-type C4-dicarboxylate transport system permease small subunit
MIVGLLTCLYLAVAGGILTLESFARGERTESTWAPLKWPLFLSMPVGLGLTALQYLADIARPGAEGRQP